MNEPIIKLCMLGTILLSSSQLFCKMPKSQDDFDSSDTQNHAVYIYQQEDDGYPSYTHHIIINQICEEKTFNETDRMHVTDAIFDTPEEELTSKFIEVVCLLTQEMNGENTRFVIEYIREMPNFLDDILYIFAGETMKKLNASVKSDDIVGLIKDLSFMEPNQWSNEIDRLIRIGK